jgi:DNA-directed RNA polymerase subunit RPC12/RpoP
MADERDFSSDDLVDELGDELTEGLAEAPAEEGNTPLFGSAPEVVQRYTHCALCGANLHFTHLTDFSRNVTQETAKCPECGLKVRRVMHRLQ